MNKRLESFKENLETFKEILTIKDYFLITLFLVLLGIVIYSLSGYEISDILKFEKSKEDVQSFVSQNNSELDKISNSEGIASKDLSEEEDSPIISKLSYKNKIAFKKAAILSARLEATPNAEEKVLKRIEKLYDFLRTSGYSHTLAIAIIITEKQQEIMRNGLDMQTESLIREHYDYLTKTKGLSHAQAIVFMWFAK